MDIVFIMGMIVGFFLGIGFSLFFTSMLAYRVISILHGNNSKQTDEDEDDPVNYWKPKGWKPDKQ